MCFLFIFSLTVHAEEDNAIGGLRCVVIDPGHGGKDPGCHGATSKEKDVTLAIGLKLGEFIEEKYSEINVIYTRKTDIFIELDERAQIANRNQADLFICIHANAGPSAAYGVETYVLGLHRTDSQRKIAERENSAIEFEDDGGEKYEVLSADAIIARQLQLSVFLDHSIMFASKLQEQFVEIGRHDRGVRQAGFLVLYKTTMPSVLIETGFLSNKEEEKFLADPDNQTQMAQSMFAAFEEYKEYYDAADQSVYSGNAYNMDRFGVREDEIDQNEIIYRVQIETSSTEISTDDAQFKNMPVWMYENNGLFKYTVGAFKDAGSANDLKKEMRADGYAHAFVVTFKGGKRVF
ncbi:MAG: N-acetylmuramoyl-L-alanine amidase, partial [Lentisphaeria bacterium]|nr:N-acetylmuramoyl-L-alanine amidase [Lentisphaeria bacterium]